MGVVATAGHHGLAEVLHGEEQACHLPIRPPQPDVYHEFQHSLKQQREGGPRKHSKPRWRLGNKELAQLWKWAELNPVNLQMDTSARETAAMRAGRSQEIDLLGSLILPIWAHRKATTPPPWQLPGEEDSSRTTPNVPRRWEHDKPTPNKD
nr:uncharacterized protein LOC109784331 [Aegilops tauschii subsp. strangulata]